MAKEVIEAVKTSEEQARIILQEANQRSKDSKREAKVTADQKYQEIIKGAIDECNKLKEQALSEGESISKPIIEKGIQEAEKIVSLDGKDLDSAVNIIIERIVNADGNS